MMEEDRRAVIDEALMTRLASHSKGSQRWIKTALQALVTDSASAPVEVDERRPRRPAPEARPKGRAPLQKPASLEDVVTGRADLREHLEEYPELAEELDGLADVIEMLRDAGEQRRRRGEQILREEILGEQQARREKDDEFA